MIFDNFDNIPIYKDFINKYGQKVDSLYPEMKSLRIRVLTVESFDSSDDSPFECVLENNEIKYFPKLCAVSKLTDNEQLAFIAHEIGHYILYIKHIKYSLGLGEELLADKFAAQIVGCDILICALERMIGTKSKEPEDDFLVMNELRTKADQINEMKKRIQALKK